MTYAARFKAVGAETFRPVTAGSGRCQRPHAGFDGRQRARISPSVASNTCCSKTPASWRIINIVADGVSDLALKRAEYQRVFASGGIEGLVAELEQQTAALGARLRADRS